MQEETLVASQEKPAVPCPTAAGIVIGRENTKRVL